MADHERRVAQAGKACGELLDGGARQIGRNHKALAGEAVAYAVPVRSAAPEAVQAEQRLAGAQDPSPTPRPTPSLV
jgi:hypothetical protein